MSLDPAPFDRVHFSRDGVDVHPQLFIFDRLTIRRLPPVTLPTVHPGGDPVLDVKAIGPHDYVFYVGLDAPFECAQDRRELHDIVRRRTRCARYFKGLADGTPATKARIAETRSVGPDFHCLYIQDTPL